MFTQKQPLIKLEKITKGWVQMKFLNYLLLIIITVAMTACSAKGNEQKNKEKGFIIMENGLKYTVDVEGNGIAAKKGDKVLVHYTGWLMDGTKFDSSKDRDQAFTFQLGAGRVIKGWEQGVEGMKVGEVRTLIIPSDLAYGKRGAGNVIPPDATLKFEVELLKVM
jgi:FKBP-type peptidyl-prolyl cis-trans isomerase